MATEKELRLALDMLTEGEEAPTLQSPRAEALRTEAVRVRGKALPWTSEEGIQGFGIGPKITDAEQLDELVLKVYVEKKKPKSKVADPVPKEVKIAGIEEKIATDVQEIGKVELESNTTKVRPAIPGFGLGHVNVTVGTFGCLVRKNGDENTLYILSNSHVLADEGVASPGDDIIQPGDLDGGAAPGDVLAHLDEFVPFEFTTISFPNLVDAAIAKVARSRVTSKIRLIGVPAGVSATVRRGMRVQKTGRTTDYTQGIIQDVNYRLALTYKKPGGGSGRVGLRDQVLCTRYTAGGDSGSAVLNMQRRVVGLHFAGSPSTSIFNKISNVLTLLNINVVTTII
jgi:hypothetical protein